jgi:hypothetical protein
MDAADYCRELESYLCQKNEGHLIRIVGPAFEQVCGWAEQGVPIAVAKKGIDQYCERYYAKGPKRRPVRIEFCEADILDLFDAWRRAIGVSKSDAEAAPSGVSTRHDSLPAHLDRAIARLTAFRAGGKPERLDTLAADAVRQLDVMRSSARQARGAERTALVERLASLDTSLMAAAAEAIDDEQARALRAEAEAEIAPFAARMAPEARESAVRAAFERLVRDSVRLPVLRFD